MIQVNTPYKLYLLLHFADRPLVAFSPVDQHQPRDVAELGDGEVRREAGLHPLLPHDPDTHARRLDHAHVVPAISYSGRHLLGLLGGVYLNLVKQRVKNISRH